MKPLRALVDLSGDNKTGVLTPGFDMHVMSSRHLMDGGRNINTASTNLGIYAQLVDVTKDWEIHPHDSMEFLIGDYVSKNHLWAYTYNTPIRKRKRYPQVTNWNGRWLIDIRDENYIRFWAELIVYLLNRTREDYDFIYVDWANDYVPVDGVPSENWEDALKASLTVLKSLDTSKLIMGNGNILPRNYKFAIDGTMLENFGFNGAIDFNMLLLKTSESNGESILHYAGNKPLYGLCAALCAHSYTHPVYFAHTLESGAFDLDNAGPHIPEYDTELGNPGSMGPVYDEEAGCYIRHYEKAKVIWTPNPDNCQIIMN